MTKRKIIIAAMWLVIAVGIAMAVFGSLSCTAAQVKERQLTQKTVEQTIGNTTTTTTQLTETTKVDTTISPDLPLPGSDGGGILGMILSALPAGGVGGLLLALWQFLKARGLKQVAEVQTLAIEEIDKTGEVKKEVASKAEHRGISAKVHNFIKGVKS